MKSRKALEAYNQFQSGWVKRVKIYNQGRSRASILQALAMHSQRLPLHPWIAVDKDDAIICAHCNCMVGYILSKGFKNFLRTICKLSSPSSATYVSSVDLERRKCLTNHGKCTALL